MRSVYNAKFIITSNTELSERRRGYLSRAMRKLTKLVIVTNIHDVLSAPLYTLRTREILQTAISHAANFEHRGTENLLLSFAR